MTVIIFSLLLFAGILIYLNFARSQPTVLYVIGNGFDIHHGYPSSYGNFRDFVEGNDPKLYEALEENFCDYDAFWSDFEEALADLDTDAITDDASIFLQSYGTNDWSDASHHDYQYEIELRIDLVTVELRKWFTRWILSLCKPLPLAFDRKINLKKDASFIQFNYTPTLELIYGVPKQNIFHIHGRAESEDSVLILGHSRMPEKRNDQYDEDSDVRVNEGQQLLDDYFINTYKTTQKIIQENKRYFKRLRKVEKIIILGHSIANVDLPYFKEIIKHINKNKTRWVISYYKADSVEQTRKTMIDLGLDTKLIEFKRIEEIDSPQLKIL